MKLASRLCSALNRLFPQRLLPGRSSPLEYSTAEYRAGSISLGFYQGRVDLREKLVLDAGCGLGGKAVYYREQGAYVVALDRDGEHIRYAAEFIKRRGAKGVALINSCLSRLPFYSQSMDVVMLNDVVEHISESLLLSALQECSRVIKEDGIICLEFPPWHGPTAAHLYDHIRIPWCQCLFSRETLSHVLIEMNPKNMFGQSSYLNDFWELNRITVERFKHLVAMAGLRIRWHRLRAVRGLSFMMGLPVIGRFFISRAIFILSR